jgi:Flp pilus assembly protein TadG
MVEFAMVFPIATMLCLGIIAGSYLFFQSSTISDGARAGARMASIETSLQDTSASGGGQCSSRSGESTIPETIEDAVAKASPQLSINPNRLCRDATYTGTPTHPYQLVQAAAGGVGNITVQVTYDTTQLPAALTAVTVTVTFGAKGIAWPLQALYPLSGHSTAPVFAPVAS